VFIRDWERVPARLKGAAGILGVLARLAVEGERAAA
jgi:hypothetical protein